MKVSESQNIFDTGKLLRSLNKSHMGIPYEKVKFPIELLELDFQTILPTCVTRGNY